MKRIFFAALMFVLTGPFITGCKETATPQNTAPIEKTATEHPSDHPTEHPK